MGRDIRDFKRLLLGGEKFLGLIPCLCIKGMETLDRIRNRHLVGYLDTSDITWALVHL